MTLIFLCTLLASISALGLGNSIGDGLWRTFVHTTELPTTRDEALSQGWYQISQSCDPNLGYLFSKVKTGPTDKHPLGLYFNAAGQVSGAQTTIYGSNKQVGDAAPANLVKMGFWKPTGDSTWVIDTSFRAPEAMCSSSPSAELLGDRVVINQDSLKYQLPADAKAALAGNWTSGSCMDSMGQHYFMDVSSAPVQSFQESNLLPVVPMYYPPDSTGKLHAFFFTTPVAQPGSKDLLFAGADWESPSLNAGNMCQNWCADGVCDWQTPAWSTMHIYLSSAWKTAKCPGGSGIVGRSCDL